jgi:hypothetical protein
MGWPVQVSIACRLAPEAFPLAQGTNMLATNFVSAAAMTGPWSRCGPFPFHGMTVDVTNDR